MLAPCWSSIAAGNSISRATRNSSRRFPRARDVLLLEMREPHAQPYLVRTADIRRAAERLLRPPERLLEAPESARGGRADSLPRSPARNSSRRSRSTSRPAANFPRRYRDLLRLRPPAAAESQSAERISALLRHAAAFAPTRDFTSDRSLRAARPTRFSEGFLDLFKIRRCQIKIRRDPSFPGCIYSEMKMCLAPCFAGCTKEEYDAEVGRVLETLDTTGASL